MSISKKTLGRLQLIVIMTLFIGPLIVASLMYRFDLFSTGATANHGDLLEPYQKLDIPAELRDTATQINSPWLLVYLNSGSCSNDCQDGLYRQQQIRLMLGSDMDRVLRVFLTDIENTAADNYPGLQAFNYQALLQKIDSTEPAQSHSGGMYLIDPLDNLVMYFAPDLDPRDVVEDLKHLLDLSRIG